MRLITETLLTSGEWRYLLKTSLNNHSTQTPKSKKAFLLYSEGKNCAKKSQRNNVLKAQILQYTCLIVIASIIIIQQNWWLSSFDKMISRMRKASCVIISEQQTVGSVQHHHHHSPSSSFESLSTECTRWILHEK